MFKIYKATDIMIGEKRAVDFIKDKKRSTEEKSPSTQASLNMQKEIDALQLEKEQLIEEAQLQYQQIVEEAEKEAARVIAEAEKEKEHILEQAKCEGYEQGFEIGKQSGYEETQELIIEAKAMKQKTLQEKKSMMRELEADIVYLIIDAVEKVIDIRMQEDHEVMLNLVKKGLDKCAYTETLIIRTNPINYDQIDQAKNKIYMMTEGVDDITVKSDPALKVGSIVIETSSGTIDSSIETQIQQIKRRFLELLQSEGAYDK